MIKSRLDFMSFLVYVALRTCTVVYVLFSIATPSPLSIILAIITFFFGSLLIPLKL